MKELLAKYSLSDILIFIVFTTFAYYVGDKIEQQNLKLINQKLADKN